MKLYIIVWFFLISLSSFYFYGLNVALPPVIAAVLSFLSLPIFLKKLKFADFSKFKLLFVFFVYVVIFGLLMSVAFQSIYYSRVFGFFLFASVMINVIFYFKVYEDYLYLAIKNVLILHLVAFYIQVFFHYFGLGYIDYLYVFTGETQRAFGGSYNADIFGQAGFVRPTGLFNEPGTYSTVIFLIFLFGSSCGVFVGKKYGNGLIYFTLISIFMSFSVFGMLYIFIYCLYLLRYNLKFIFPIIIFASFLFSFAYDIYLYPRFFSGMYDENGLGFRFNAISDFISYASGNLWVAIFGFGFLTDFSVFFEDYVWADLGLVFYGLVVFGVFGQFMLIGSIFGRYIFKNHVLPLCIVFMLSKIPITSMLFWVLLIGISYLANHSKSLQLKSINK
jgi:hypothetical protein